MGPGLGSGLEPGLGPGLGSGLGRANATVRRRSRNIRMPEALVPNWTSVVAIYFAYLTALAIFRPIGIVRSIAVFALAADTVVAALLLAQTGSSWFLRDVAVPGIALLVGYWSSALVARSPDVAIERSLLRVDRRIAGILRTTRWRPPRVLLELVEFAYLLVYPILPVGAVLLWAAGGSPSVLDRYWWLVLGSGFACYATLPWVTVRPPRVLEDAVPYGGRHAAVRALNLVVLEHGSHARATIPSGHVATAVAACIGVAPAGAELLVVYCVLAGLIAIATVWGRYHYSVDTIAGIFVPLLFL